ncbi:hypothetical protein Pfo_012750 [Paulownia fortunei]|nr:hypothetical protein Pfo_012750 [Paulownia fortunei]
MFDPLRLQVRRIAQGRKLLNSSSSALAIPQLSLLGNIFDPLRLQVRRIAQGRKLLNSSSSALAIPLSLTRARDNKHKH